MTKSTIYHDRDGEAIDALRRALPTYWLYKDTREKFSGKEYSEDLIIEIVNDDEKRTVTGVEFAVQNKTDIEIRKSHVTIRLETNDVRRLMDLQRPALIHGYDLKTRTSYWLWLNEWYPSQSKKLKEKKSVPLNIPKRNVLDDRAVPKIELYARWEHQQRKIQDHAGMVARQYPNDYDVSVRINRAGITTVFEPKHQAAVPTIHALDDNASDAMIKAIETGEPVPLVGSFTFSNLPDLILEGIDEPNFTTWLVPYMPEDQRSALKIELLDMSHQVVFRSPFVEVRQTKPGTVVKKFEGTDMELGVTYKFTFDRHTNTSKYSIDLHSTPTNARNLKKHFDQLNLLRTVTKIRITNLKTEQVIEGEASGFFGRETHSSDKVWERLATALVTIEDKLNVRIDLPKKIDGPTLRRAEWIAEGIRDGLVKVNVDFIPDNGVLICGDPAHIAREMLAAFDRDGHLAVTALGSTSEIEIELLNDTLHLGLAQYLFANMKIVNADNLRSILAQEDTTDATSVETILTIDQNEIYLRFDRWYSEARLE